MESTVCTENLRLLAGHLSPQVGKEPDPKALGDPAKWGVWAQSVALLQHGAHPDDVRKWLPAELQQTLFAQDVEEGRPPPKTVYTIQELLATEFEPSEWVVPGLLPRGAGNLSGLPKRGKSLMLLQLGIAVGSGGWFLGRRLEQCAALLILYEDTETRIKNRSLKMGVPKGCRLTIAFQWRHFPDGILDLERAIRDERFGFVGIDTLGRAYAAKHIDWNSYSDAQRAVAPLQELTRSSGASLLTIDHMGKASNNRESDPVLDLQGSVAKAGVFDCLWGVYLRDKRTHLHAVARDLGDVQLVIGLDTTTLQWDVLGHVGGPVKGTREHDVYQVLKERGGEARVTDLATQMKEPTSNIDFWLQKLVSQSVVVQVEKRGAYRILPEM